MKHMDASTQYPNLTRNALEQVEKDARSKQWIIQRSMDQEQDRRFSIAERDAALGFYIGKMLVNGVNGGNAEAIADGLMLALTSDHRTLQQSAIRAIIQFLQRYATLEFPSGIDGRNMAAVELCKEISKVAAQYGLPLV